MCRTPPLLGLRLISADRNNIVRANLGPLYTLLLTFELWAGSDAETERRSAATDLVEYLSDTHPS